MSRIRWIRILIVTTACLLPALAAAHPGSGIVVDRLGQVYFVDMVSGVWKLDAHGALTHIPGSAFHWMTIDASNRFAAAQLPSGSSGDIDRIGVNPTLLLASDYPIAMVGMAISTTHRIAAGRRCRSSRCCPPAKRRC